MEQITEKRLKELKKKEVILKLLEEFGVDKWDYYDDALDAAYKEYPELFK